MERSKTKESSSRSAGGDGSKKDKANTHKLALKGEVLGTGCGDIELWLMFGRVLENGRRIREPLGTHTI